MSEPKPLPKSLHTVSVLVRMVNAYSNTSDWENYTVDDLLQVVVGDLGLAGKPDTYGLIEAARKQLEQQ